MRSARDEVRPRPHFLKQLNLYTCANEPVTREVEGR